MKSALQATGHRLGVLIAHLGIVLDILDGVALDQCGVLCLPVGLFFGGDRETQFTQTLQGKTFAPIVAWLGSGQIQSRSYG